MKRLYFILGALALVAVTMATSPAAGAQENGNRDEYGKVVRGPYETNAFGDNWFIGAGGGINVFYNDGYDMADRANVLRYSHENPEIKALYAEFLDSPLSHKAHELLHTKQKNWTL